MSENLQPESDPEPRRRPRTGEKPKSKGETIVDPDAYVSNKCTSEAREVNVVDESFRYRLWLHKHYYNRNQHGEDDGTARDGIDEPLIIKMVSASFRFLEHYSSRVKGMGFINEDDATRHHAMRVVVFMKIDGISLNAIIQGHYLRTNEVEVTVITAKRQNDYSLSPGQYAIELFENEPHASVLYK